MKVVLEKKDQLQKQIEFYFSNSNLPFDKFLKEQCASEGGWVDLSVVVAFSRVQALLGTQFTQPDSVPDDCIEAIAGILKELDSIEISEDGYQIRRKDMPESWDEIIAEVARRTVHVACLPFNATLEKLVERFSDFGSVNQVRLLKRTSEVSEHRVFRGTCLIELGTEEEAKAVLATPVEYDDCLVRIQTKADYDAATQKAADEGLPRHQFVDLDRPKLVADGLPPEEEVKDEAEDEGDTGKEDKANADNETPAETEGDEKKKDEKKEDAPFELLDSMKGRLLRFELEVGDVGDIPTGRSLKDSFPEDCGLQYVDQGRDELKGKGILKMQDPEHVSSLLLACTDKLLEIKSGHKLRLAEVEGDDEFEFWKKDAADLAEKAGQRGEKRKSFGEGRGGRGRGRGGRGGGGGRGGKRGRH